MSSLCAFEARAQQLAGRIVDSTTSRPVVGALVVLVDSAGTTAARALTDEAGAFRLHASPGRYRLRTLRIGFRPFTSPAMHLLAGQTLERDVLIASHPIQLAAVTVVARNPCRSLSAGDTSANVVWEQARTAIASAQVTANAGGYDVTALVYDRTLSPDRSEVRNQHAVLKSGEVVRAWLSMSPDSIRRFGYVLRRADGAVTYVAPDLELLVSDDFASAHCFRLVREPAHGRIGVEFAPNGDRRLPDIRGTVWLDVATAELRQLDFRYTNLPADLERAGASGVMRFARFSNGGWGIADWDIQMPVLARRPIQRVESGTGAIRRSAGTESFVSEVHTGGGELVLVQRGTDTLWTGRRRPFSGLVIDSASGRGVAGLRVRLLPLDVTLRTDNAGRFEGPDVLPGRYSAMVERADGTEQYYAFSWAGPESPVALRLPAARAPPKARSTDATLTVVVRATEGEALPGAEARLLGTGRTGRSDPRGVVVLDRLPTGAWRLLVRRLGYAPADTALALEAGDTTRVTVTLRRVATRLDTVTVSAVPDAGALPEFETRRLRATGFFLSTAQLRAQDDRGLGDVLRARLPGLGIQTTASGQFLYSLSQQGPKALLTSRPCYVQIVIDGISVFKDEPTRKPLEPPDFSMIATRDFDGVEFYSQVSRTPPEFRTAGAMCGTLVLWSRRR